MKIAFNSQHMSIRGTTYAVYDYAHYNELLLRNESVVLFQEDHSENNAEVMAMFRNRFKCRTYKNYSDVTELDRILTEEGVDLLYIIKGGGNDGVVAGRVRTVVHAVFPCSSTQAHGASWAFVSEWLSAWHKAVEGSSVAYVPHIVDCPPPRTDLRKQYAIPGSALVFGRHGGYYQFDNGAAREAVDRLVQRNPNIFFLLLNTAKFGIEHPQKLYIPGTPDRQFKADFVAACDAMLHGRLQGETFGISNAEFSVQNKPAFICPSGSEHAHFYTLGDACYRYHNVEELVDMLEGFKPENKAWDAYRKFTPAYVMSLFKTVFIEGVSNA